MHECEDAKPDFLGSHDVNGHVTIGFAVGTFLLVVNDDHASILHCYEDTGPQRFWGHDLDHLRSRGIIGYVTIRLVVVTFLLVVNDDHASILHCYDDTKPQSSTLKIPIHVIPDTL